LDFPYQNFALPVHKYRPEQNYVVICIVVIIKGMAIVTYWCQIFQILAKQNAGINFNGEIWWECFKLSALVPFQVRETAGSAVQLQRQ
jgi:hypothetical protein